MRIKLMRGGTAGAPVCTSVSLVEFSSLYSTCFCRVPFIFIFFNAFFYLNSVCFLQFEIFFIHFVLFSLFLLLFYSSFFSFLFSSLFFLLSSSLFFFLLFFSSFILSPILLHSHSFYLLTYFPQ